VSARIAAVAARARLTEGQLYSCLITLAVAVLLASGLGNVHGVAGAALAQPPLALPTAEPVAPVVVPEPVPTGVTPPLDLPTGSGSPLPPADPVPVVGPDLPDYPEVPLPPGGPTPPPKPEPCDNQAVQDAGTQVITTANELSGGRLPQKDLLAALGTVTGCDPTDPALLAVGLLVGLGHTIPDPGLPGPPPLVPYVEIPQPVVTALQPLRPQLDAVCGVLGTGNEVAALFIWAYPAPVPQTTAQVFFQALSACGQVRKP
jgi:hypothetical protein